MLIYNVAVWALYKTINEDVVVTNLCKYWRSKFEKSEERSDIEKIAMS